MLIDRLALIEVLRRVASDPSVEAEQHRKAKLSAELDEIKRHRAVAAVQIPVPSDVHGRHVCDLPEGVHLQSGRLTIDFVGAEQLLSRLYEVSQAAMNDYDVFCEAAGAQPAQSQQSAVPAL